MVLVIVLACVLVALAIVFIVFGVKLVVDLVKKNKRSLTLNIVMLAASFCLFVVVGIVDAVLLGAFVYENREEIVTRGLEFTSDIVSQGLVLTYEGIVKSWDKELVRRLGNIDVSVEGVAVAREKGAARYTIKLLFTNHNKNTESTSIGELVAGNYLTVCGQDDAVYALDPKSGEGFYLPTGKSAAVLGAAVPENVTLRYLRFAEKKIYLPAE